MNRVIHQVWVQGEKNLPDQFKRNREQWAEAMPGFSMKLWDDEEARATWPEYAAVSNKCYHHATRADLILARALRDFGGLATGTDCLPNNPTRMMAFLEVADSMLVITPGRKEISNGLQWCADPGHPFWECVCRHQLREKGRFLGNKNVPEATGPGCYMEAFQARKWQLFLVSASIAFTHDWAGAWTNRAAFINAGFAASWTK